MSLCDLTTPPALLFMGGIVGALLASAVWLVIIEWRSYRAAGEEYAWLAGQRREATGLRSVIAACDRGEDQHRIRQIASLALYPGAEPADDTPVSAQGNAARLSSVHCKD